MNRKHRGVVIVVDALGTRALPDGSDWEAILDRRVSILRRAQEFNLEKKGVLEPSASGEFVHNLSMVPRTIGFSDTVAFTIETPDDFRYVLTVLAQQVSVWFVRAVLDGELFRGAIAAGDYFVDNEIVVGPATNAAGRVYNEAKWGGLIVEPETSKCLEGLHHPFFYPLWTVLTDHGPTEFSSLGWPAFCRASGAKNDAVRTRLQEIFDRGKGVPEVEIKRKATLEFFDAVSAKADDLNKQAEEMFRSSFPKSGKSGSADP